MGGTLKNVHYINRLVLPRWLQGKNGCGRHSVSILFVFFLLSSFWYFPVVSFADQAQQAPALSSVDQATLQKGWEAYNIGHYKETLALLQPLAVNGNATAQVLVGRCFESGLGVEQDLETAVKWYSLAAEQGDPQGLLCLAYCYENGIGVEKDGT
ncbi:MAG: sel1 repeat family protein, partial [Desulfovibrio sp.]|nr:sel1 repeat family protein [Desulfovibrio sp.]